MSLMSRVAATDVGGSRAARGQRGLRVRSGMLLAAALSLVLVGTAVAQSPVPEASAVPAAVGPDAVDPAAAPALEGTDWVLTATGLEPGQVVSMPYRVTLRLQDGIAAGHDGCNDYFAPYVTNGSALSIGRIGVTFPPATCPAEAAAYETAYFASLASVSSFLLIESTLVLVDGTGTAILTYQAAPASPVVGAWLPTKYRIGDGEFNELVPGSVLTLVLESDGRAHGFTGCDRFDSSYTLDDREIAFAPPIIGPRPCASFSLQAQADGYLGALANVRLWAFDDQKLKLRDATDTTQISLEAAPAPIFARTWAPTGIAGPDGTLVPPVPGSSLSLDFHGDGRLSGSTGCNDFFGDYQVAGGAIDIGPLGTTRMACASDELAAQEASYLAALDAATLWTLDGQDLVLLGADGATLMTLVTQPDVVTEPTPTPSPKPTPKPTAKPTPKPTAATVAVPDVVGDQEADALVAFGAAGVTAGERTGKYDPAKRDTVLSTDPKAGIIVARGTPVDYKVSRGPSPSPSPTPKPTAKPTPKPTAKPTPKPTAKPTPKPTAKPSPSDPLNQTSWILSRYDDGSGDAIDLPVQAETPTAAFASGSIAGFAGCNTYTATYTVQGTSSITFGGASTTAKACAELGEAVEAIYLSSLAQMTTWKLSSDGRTLTLSGASEAPVLTFSSPLR